MVHHDSLERILYVEDEPDIRTIAEMALTRIGGYSVQLCESGPDAIARAPAFAPQLILLDVMMPGMDGVETLAHLRMLPEMRETPVVFMTAKAQRHEADHYRALGAVGVVPKPFDPVTLSQAIADIWNTAAGTKGAANAG